MLEDKNRLVVLVDKDDNQLGLVDIWKAHRGRGLKHRAVSVLLHDGNGRVLLQKRSDKKPLWPLFWSNTVCTHPYPKEGVLECAERRLGEEMGIQIKKMDLKEVYKLDYQAKYNDELSENEVTNVVVGIYKGGVSLNADEAIESRWVEWGELEKVVEAEPEKFTPWFRLIMGDERIGNLINFE